MYELMRLNSKAALFLLANLLITFPLMAQLKVGGSAAVIRGDAALEISTERKGLLLPRVRNAALGASPLDTAANGMLIFNTDDNSLMVKNGGWKRVADASTLSFLWTMAGNANVDPALHFLGTTGSQPLVFKTNSAEAMRIDPQAKIGIGTANPSSRLHVNGSLATNLAIATSDFSVADSNSVIIMNNSTDAILTLQDASTCRGRSLEIVSYNLGKIIYSGASVKIQGATQIALQAGHTVRLVSDGTDWVVTSGRNDQAFSLPITVAGVSPYTATADDYTIIVTPAGGTGNFVVTLPAASTSKGRVYVIKRFDAATPLPVEVTPAGGDQIETGTSFIFDGGNLRSYTFQSDGVSRWYVTSTQ
jgi:hypothetical protein